MDFSNKYNNNKKKKKILQTVFLRIAISIINGKHKKQKIFQKF